MVLEVKLRILNHDRMVQAEGYKNGALPQHGYLVQQAGRRLANRIEISAVPFPQPDQENFQGVHGSRQRLPIQPGSILSV